MKRIRIGSLVSSFLVLAAGCVPLERDIWMLFIVCLKSRELSNYLSQAVISVICVHGVSRKHSRPRGGESNLLDFC